jgi:hypothetical protein
MDLAPSQIMLPLLSGIYRAPLGEIAWVDFSMFLSGRTGTQKSELSAMAQAHFGAGFHGKNLPCNWYGTVNALERMAFSTKDAVLTIADFAPNGTTAEVQSMHSRADRLLRGQGNRTGRGRMNPDGSLRPEYYPRGLILCSGEDIPKGRSLRGRMFILEISPGQVNLEGLTRVQRDAAEGLLALAMSAYLKWLAPQMDKLKAQSADTFGAYRAKAREALKNAHDRTPDIVASLGLGLLMLSKFAKEIGALTHEKGDELFQLGWGAILEAAQSQARHQGSEDPVNQFLRLLNSALSSGLAHLANTKANGSPADATNWGWRYRNNGNGDECQPQGLRIGWIDEQSIFLDPDAVFSTVQKLAHSQGTGLPITQPTLWKRLAEKSLLASTEPGRNTVRRMIAGKRPHVVHLSKATLTGDTTPQIPA